MHSLENLVISYRKSFTVQGDFGLEIDNIQCQEIVLWLNNLKHFWLLKFFYLTNKICSPVFYIMNVVPLYTDVNTYMHICIHWDYQCTGPAYKPNKMCTINSNSFLVVAIMYCKVWGIKPTYSNMVNTV